VGFKHYKYSEDPKTYADLNSLTKSITSKIRDFRELVQIEPTDEPVSMNQPLQDHLIACDQGIKEVTVSLKAYQAAYTEDLTVIGSINKIISQLQCIKKVLETEDRNHPNLLTAVASISSSLEKFCSAVYYLLCELNDANEVIREQVMETMQNAIHCNILLCLVTCEKNLQFLTQNVDGLMLASLRGLLLCVAIVMDGITYMKKSNLINEGNPETHVGLGKNEINEALIYILHFGRPLIKSEEEKESPSPIIESNNNSAKNSIKMSYSQASLIQFLLSPRSNHKSSPSATRSNTKSDLSPIKFNLSYQDEDDLLSINPDDYNENNLPPGFDPPPKIPIYKKECSTEEYKAYMLARYEYETWENKLLLYKLKLNQQIEDIKQKRAIT